MQYYPRVKSLKDSLKPKHYALYSTLRNLYLKNYGAGYSELYAMFESLENKRLQSAMLDALNACANYGEDVRFEISPRNVAVNATGGLILLDCFFMQSALITINNN